MLIEPKFLKDKLALVTGSSGGTGRDIALELARQGANLAVHYRSKKDAAEEVLEEIRTLGGQAEAFGANLDRSAEIKNMFKQINEKFGPISILVNAVGPYSDRPFGVLDENEWDFILNTNVKAALICTQLAAQGMQLQGWGRIINIAATSAFWRTHSIYGLAKSALLYLTECLALELAPNITVNAIVPSQIASPHTDTLAEYKAVAIATTPLGRLVTQKEIARMAALICSPLFDVVTGQRIVMDGGRSIPVTARIDLSQIDD